MGIVRTQCTNHLRNLRPRPPCFIMMWRSIYPLAAGEWWWVGDPDRGFRAAATGRLDFSNLMPFTEEGSAYKSASDGQPDAGTPRQLDAIRDIVNKPLTSSQL